MIPTTPETYGIGAIAVAVVALLAWVLRDKSKQDVRTFEIAERSTTAIEKDTAAKRELSQANILLADNVSKNTQATEKMLQMLNKLLKSNGHPQI